MKMQVKFVLIKKKGQNLLLIMIHIDSFIIFVNQKYKDIEITIDYFNSLGIELNKLSGLIKIYIADL
mgnify:CR=1 FL=1